MKFSRFLLTGGLFSALSAQCVEKYTESVAADGSCVCYDGITGAACDQIDYELVCDQSFVTVQAKMSTFERVGFTEAGKLRLNDPSCRGVEIEVDGELYVKFTITGSPAGCGADVMSNGTYIRYQNYFRDNDVTNDPSVATRSQIQVGFACEFPVDYRVALPAIMPTVSTVAVQTSRGKFVVSMDMYEDNGFTKKLDFKNQQVTVAKGDWLHLEMNLRTVVDDVASNLIAEQCWATPVAQPHSQAPDEQEIYHNILMNGCPADSSVQVYANGANDNVRFKVQMFGFKGQDAGSVWLHCVVRVCGDDCERECHSIYRRAADLDKMPTSYTDIAVVTSPEISVSDDGSVEIEGTLLELEPFIEDTANETVIYALSAILILVIAAILVAALMIHQQSRVPLLDGDCDAQKKTVSNAGTGFFRG